MSMMEKQKSPLPIIAGVLIIVSEGIKLLGLLLIFIASFFIIVPENFIFHPLVIILIILVPFLALLVVAVLGGISALQRKRWGLALAGSIISLLPFNLLGLVALILIALSRNEFD
jgi:hypothetical protein